jgi:hypothetical protein
MAQVNRGRFSAEVTGEGVVLFLIGMRVNSLWRVNKWWPALTAMPKMVSELMANSELGLLARPRTYLSGRTVMVVQYWRDFDSLESYARAADKRHLPAWRAFNKAVRDNGAVGIFHETYRVGPGHVEAFYGNFPLFGLADATTLVPAGRLGQSAARRMGVRDVDDTPVEPY